MSFEMEKEKKKSSVLSFDRSDRLFATGSEISTTMYNLTIGLYICIGFAINFIMAFFFKDFILGIHPIGVLIAYFLCVIVGSIITHASTSPFVCTIAFIIMAIGMGLLLTFYLVTYNVSTVYTAFGITIGIAAVMTILAMIHPSFFASIGKGLLVSLAVAIIAELVCVLFFRQYFVVFDYIIIVIFCGFIGYDVVRAQSYAKTVQNAIKSAADLYIDLVNILIRILSIMGDSKS